MPQRPILCPHCRRLIGSEDAACHWCGAPRSGAGNFLAAFIARYFAGDPSLFWLIAVNVAYFVVSLCFSTKLTFSGNPLTFFSPDQGSLFLLGGSGSVPVFEYGRFWTLLAANYLHGGLLHIFFNMLALRQIGPLVISEFGASRTFIIYTLGGVFGYLVSCLAGVGFTIGASAAVCSLIGALYYFGKSRGGRYGTAVTREVTGWLVSLALFGLLVPEINNWAHGGGVVGGIVLAKLVGYRERSAERRWHRAAALLLVVVTAGVLAWACLGTYLYPFPRN